MDGLYAVDATLVFHDGRYWMFACLASPNQCFDHELSIFHATSPLGPWIPHAQIRDPRRAAGKAGCRLPRQRRGTAPPGTGSRCRYGSAMTFNLVETLTPTDYRERTLGRVVTDWFPGGVLTHTFNRSRGLDVLDIMATGRTITPYDNATSHLTAPAPWPDLRLLEQLRLFRRLFTPIHLRRARSGDESRGCCARGNNNMTLMIELHDYSNVPSTGKSSRGPTP